ncbi:hypothetical protein SDC9_100112 [bioreactor metagenome]|uniref:Uncharacterized protein n=1 Tax=bioreactor metagenome TaxID=1076179 RepID=A0A645AJE6_9ZZZZ
MHEINKVGTPERTVHFSFSIKERVISVLNLLTKTMEHPLLTAAIVQAMLPKQ